MQGLVLGPLLGVGGYARTFRAVAAGREVALKTPKEDQACRQAILHEVTLYATVPEHPHLGQMLGHYIDDEQPALLIELCDADLAAALTVCHMGPQDKAGVAAGVVSGIAHLHRHDVIHCDLKPSNVLLAQGGLVPKIIDLGIARVLSKEGSALIGERVVGSPGYRAPELYINLSRPNSVTRLYPTVDLWALGCIIMEVELGSTGLLVAPDDRRMYAFLKDRLPSLHRLLTPKLGDCVAVLHNIIPCLRWPAAKVEALLGDDLPSPRPVRGRR